MNKKYAVIYFPLENMYSEIPTSWLTEDRLKCWWPKTINAHNLMKRGDKPDTTWIMYDINVEAYCSTLESARKRAEDPEYSTGNESEEAGRGKRKKKINPYISSGSSSEDEMTPPPSPKTVVSKKITGKEPDITTIQCGNGNTKSSPLAPPSTCVEEALSSEGCIKKATVITSNVESDINDIPIIFIGEDNNILEPHSTLTSTSNGTTTIQDLLTEIEHLKKICIANQRFIQDIGKMLKLLVQKTGDNVVDTQMNLISGKIPLKTLDSIMLFETQLRNSEEIKKSFIRHLKALGGRDGRDHLFRSLASVFTNSLATQCSWHGQRGNFKLNNLSFMKLITDVVACQYVKTITISDTEKFCSEWFRLAKQRLMREQKHPRNDNDNSIQLT